MDSLFSSLLQKQMYDPSLLITDIRVPSHSHRGRFWLQKWNGHFICSRFGNGMVDRKFCPRCKNKQNTLQLFGEDVRLAISVSRNCLSPWKCGGGSNIGSKLCTWFVLFVLRDIRICLHLILRDKLISFGSWGNFSLPNWVTDVCLMCPSYTSSFQNLYSYPLSTVSETNFRAERIANSSNYFRNTNLWVLEIHNVLNITNYLY